ncbi:MAG: hypothetical protein L3I99_05045 [Sulfurimonas sp.]|nr:hypothetical protein [Sulfurimonas sp.]
MFTFTACLETSTDDELIKDGTTKNDTTKNDTVKDDTVTAIDDNATMVDDNATMVDDNATVVDDNATMVDDNATMVDDNATVVDDNATVVDDNATVIDDAVIDGSIGDNVAGDIYSFSYKGMPLYSKDMQISQYGLTPISNTRFYSLTDAQQEIVADKLLATLYFGMPREDIKSLIDGGDFITSIRTMINESTNDLGVAETRLNDSSDDGEFFFSDRPAGAAEIGKILARFYVLDNLDKEYINYWSAYVLTSTILFSPANELESTQNPNIERVYSSLVRAFRDEFTLEYSTFLHMISDDNWRRFRSPEDNGREMLEIFLQDFDDSLVPIAGQALKNWSLDRDSDILVIGLDENLEPLELYGETIADGYDFYRAVVKSSDFTAQVTSRLVNIYFPYFTSQEKESVIANIVASDIGTWKDILLQIVLSEAYLFESDKPKAAEELFYSLSKKVHFKHKRRFFNYFAKDLIDMNQASMKYKLGKYVGVPLDTQSFITYHKTIREKVLIPYHTQDRGGWLEQSLIPDELFDGVDATNHVVMLEHLIDYLFMTIIARPATTSEKDMFKAQMLTENGEYMHPFRVFRNDNNIDERRYVAIVVMDYISRLTQNYKFEKVL